MEPETRKIRTWLVRSPRGLFTAIERTGLQHDKISELHPSKLDNTKRNFTFKFTRLMKVPPTFKRAVTMG